MLHVRATPGVHGYAREGLTWRQTDRSTMQLAPVRASREHGQFLGYVQFDANADTGLHQHLGPASSYFLAGGLTDYQGTAGVGEVGINLAGATHSATAYAPTLIASRLEAPVIYPEAAREALHTGARQGDIVNPMPDEMPDINIRVEDLPWGRGPVPRIRARTLFDYAPTEFDRRCVQIQVMPGAATPPFRTAAALDVFVMGGALTLGGETQSAGAFFVVDEGTRLTFSSQYGALAIVWSEGPIAWEDADLRDPFGF